MKLTEKELNEFPIGTKITSYINTYFKVGKDVYGANCLSNAYWNSKELSKYYSIEKVEIPTYTEYIPPKPILDEKEKEYLSAVIRPWRDTVRCIRKYKHQNKEYIYIHNKNIFDGIGFPYFKAGTMYKGMELDKEYTLEELVL